MNKMEKPINVIGISTVTSNEEAFNKNTIGKLWGEFLNNPIKENLGNLSSSSIYAVYSDYESDYNGKYKITIGYAVDDVHKIPNGLTTVTIPAGKYKSFKSKSSSVEDIIETWQTIWQTDPSVLQPNFTVTFEEYKDNGEVVIYIGHD